MFLRRTRSGPREYLQLAESYRTPAGVRQRVLFSFGRVDQLDPVQIDTLIRGLERFSGNGAVRSPDMPAPTIECQSARTLGDTWLLTQLWTSLGLDAALRRALGARRMAHAPWVRAMVFHRLCDPGSKLGTLRWLETAIVPGVDTEHANHSALLRAMDALEDVADALQTQVLATLRPLLDQDVSVVFYDLTTVRAEGDSELTDDVRAVGHSKDRALPSRQVVVGVVQSACGLPLMHTVHKGNVAETATLTAMLTALKARLSVKRVVVVADRGLMSLEQLDLLESDAIAVDYLIAVPARRYADLSEVVDGLGFEPDTTAVKEARDAKGRRLIVARDAQRAADMRQQRLDSIAAIETLATTRVEKLDAQDTGTPSRGRKLTDTGVYHQVQSLIEDARLGRIIKAQVVDGLFSWHIDSAALARAERLDGVLMLVTRIETLDPDALLARYKALADIERGFRVLKQEIEIAPMYHRLPERIRAHAAICFLALVLHRHLRARLRATGRTESPDRVLAHLRRIQEHRLTIGDTAHRTTSRLSELQRELLSQLNLPFPTLPTTAAAPKATSRRQQPSRKATTKPTNPAKM